MAHILKIGLAVVRGDSILLVRKRGSSTYILPGGKPEAGEDDRSALTRELMEELGCRIEDESLRFMGSFTDRIQGSDVDTVTVRLYDGQLVGDTAAASEIESLRWHPISNHADEDLAPSLRNLILPFLSVLTRKPRRD